MSNKYNIRISGFGGQGIVLCGYIIGRAASLYDGKNAVFTQSYGPAARGGACSANVVIADEKIGYPLVRMADFFIVLSKEGYEKFINSTTPNALIFADIDLVNGVVIDSKKVFGIPATRLAEDMGKKIVANIIMLGFFFGITGIVSREAISDSVRTFVKKAFIDINLKALDKGYEYAGKIKKKQT